MTPEFETSNEAANLGDQNVKSEFVTNTQDVNLQNQDKSDESSLIKA